MILEKIKFSISKQLVNPQGQLKNAKKMFWQKFLAFLNANSLHSSRPHGRLSQIPKTGGFR